MTADTARLLIDGRRPARDGEPFTVVDPATEEPLRPSRVKRAMSELRVGKVWVNDPVVDNLAAPLGGMRASGHARELGLEGLWSFTATRHVHWNLDLQAKPWWFSQGEEEA